MSKPKPWDGVLFVILCPIKGGGWHLYEGTYRTDAEAKRHVMTNADRIVRIDVRMPSAATHGRTHAWAGVVEQAQAVPPKRKTTKSKRAVADRRHSTPEESGEGSDNWRGCLKGPWERMPDRQNDTY